MSQPNFQAMSQKELQKYVLSHREDQNDKRRSLVKNTRE